jgi:hypothetical protein
MGFMILIEPELFEEYALSGVCDNCGKKKVHQVLGHNHSTPGPVILLKNFYHVHTLDDLYALKNVPSPSSMRYFLDIFFNVFLSY